MKVYLLSDHGESGSEHVVATLDKSKVEGLAEKYFGGYGMDRPQYASGHPTMREKLLELLKIDMQTEDRDGRKLCYGWGGPQLHIIELE